MSEIENLNEASEGDISAIQTALAEAGLVGDADGSASEEAVTEDQTGEEENPETPETEEATEDGEAEGEPGEEEASETPEAEEEGATAEEAPEDEAKRARGLSSLARREALVQQREAAVAAREKALATGSNSDRQELVKAQQALQHMRQLAADSPAEFLEAMGHKDLDFIAARIYYKQHPEAAPPGFAQQIESQALARKVDRLQQEITERDNRAAEAQRTAQAINYLSGSAKTMEDLEYLSAEAGEDPAAVGREMFDTLSQMRAEGNAELANASQIADPVQRDAAIARLVGRVLNDHKAKVYERRSKVAEKIAELRARTGNGAKQTKKAPPVAAEKKPARSMKKLGTAITRPKAVASSHEDDIDAAIRELENI